MTSAGTRLRQGFHALRALVVPLDDRAAAEILPDSLLMLFQSMRPAERQHSLNVLGMIRARGESDRSLWQAALLHDCGKVCARYDMWERTLIVLIKSIAPNQVACWGSGSAHGWRRPFAVYEQHPQWGADRAARAGADPLVVALIRNHARPVDHAITLVAGWPVVDQDRFIRLLKALQAADDLS